jgi:aryl-alcohol dehydrogenase-like predicted oxidoreductase
MKTRRIGRTDLVVSQIGFGCGGNAGLMVRGTGAEQERVIACALDSGITYFDNAPDYGDGLSEENLGHALQVLAARPVINTKVEIRAENLNDIAGHVVRSIDDSLKRLRVDTLDIVQIHNGPVSIRPNLQGRDYKTLWIEDYVRPGGAIEGVRRLLESGKARYAGLVSRGNDSAAIHEVLKTGVFHLVNVPFTLLNPTAGYPRPGSLDVQTDYGDVIGGAKAAGAGTAIFSPLAGGLLTEALLTRKGTHPLARSKDVKALEGTRTFLLAQCFQALAAQHGMSIVQLAYRFILTHRGVSTVLGGFSSSEQVNEAVTAAADFDSLSDEVIDEIRRVWNEDC